MALSVASLSTSRAATVRPARASVKVQASLRTEAAKVAKAAGLSVAGFALALSANAATVKLGGDDGALAFVPSTTTISAGGSVDFVNNAGFPHNIMFDEDEIPAGESADALSNEDYLNAPGETVTKTFKTAGSYSYYCEPHQGAGMVGKIIVE